MSIPPGAIYLIILILLTHISCPAGVQKQVPGSVDDILQRPAVVTLQAYYQDHVPITDKSPYRYNWPRPMRDMLGGQQAVLLDTILSVVGHEFSGRAYRLYLLATYLSQANMGAYRRELDSLLSKIDNLLQTVASAAAELYSYMDWYEGDDWQKQFVATGFYDKVLAIRQQVILYQGMSSWYRMELAVREVVNSGHYSRQARKMLKRIHELLADMNSMQVAPRLAELCYIRLARLLKDYNTRQFDEAVASLQGLLRQRNSPEYVFTLHLELLKCYRRKNQVEQYQGEIASLARWWKTHREQLKQRPLPQLEFMLIRIRDQHDSPAIITSLLQEMEEIIKPYPALQAALRILFADNLQQYFISAPDKNAFIRRLSDYQVLSLGWYYQSRTHQDEEQAVQVWEAFIRTRDLGNHYLPQVLFNLASVHYRRAERYQKERIIAKSREECSIAVKTWDYLSRKFPQWQDELQPEISSARAAELSAELVFRLFQADRQRYMDLALKVMPTLTGRLSSEGSELHGDFAQSSAALKNRYNYALVLLAAGQYERAGRVFQVVPEDSPDKSAARYQAVYCWYQASRQNSAKAIPETLYQSWLNELSQLADRSRDNGFISKVVALLCQIALEADKVDMAAARLSAAMKANPDSTELPALAVNFMQQQREQLLTWHCHNEQKKLRARLAVELPLAYETYLYYKGRKAGKLYVPAVRLLLEQAALAVLDDELAGEAAVIIQSAREAMASLLDKKVFAGELWFTRCRALFALAEKNFALSHDLWYRIRQSTAGKENAQEAYYWWESRYYGLRCLLGQNTPVEASRVIDIFISSHSRETSPWLDRIRQMRQSIK